MNESTAQQQALATVAQLDAPDLPMLATSTTSLILDGSSMDSIMRMADIMAKGRATVPTHLQGSAADCAAVIMQAMQWRMNPFAVAQKTHIVNGALGYEAQLVNAAIQASGVTDDRFSYEWYGPWEKIIGKTKVVQVPAKEGKKAYEFRVPDYGMNDEVGLGVRISATLRGEAAPRVLDLMLVQASVRNSPLWATDPKQQLAYLAVKRWARLYAPDVILGVYSPDELAEINPEPRDITPGSGAGRTPAVGQAEASADLMAKAKDAAAKGTAAYHKFWVDSGPSVRKALAQHHENLKGAAVLADKDRTVDASPAAAAGAPDSAYDGLLADLGAACDEGAEAFEAAWAGLSKATQEKLASAYPAMQARANSVGVAQ